MGHILFLCGLNFINIHCLVHMLATLRCVIKEMCFYRYNIYMSMVHIFIYIAIFVYIAWPRHLFHEVAGYQTARIAVSGTQKGQNNITNARRGVN